MKQSDVFKAGEGDAWYTRNKDKRTAKGAMIISDLIQKYTNDPKFIYEVGCADGWMIKQFGTHFKCKTGGIDPSRTAIDNAVRWETDNVYYGNATKLRGAEGCDVLIYGFCLYLCDPEDYFAIVQEGDRVLKDGGYLIIHDFDSRYTYPLRVPYKHKEGVWSHHVSFEYLWAGHPWYTILEQRTHNGESFTIMKKDSTTAWSKK